jgi:hypothetical protein
VQGAGEFASGRAGLALVVAVGLVDGDDVGELQDAALDPLQCVAGARDREQQERVHHSGDGHLGLPDPHGLDEHHVVARRLHQHDGLAGGPRDPAERAGARRGPDERVLVVGERRHAGLVAEDRALRARGRRVDGEHGHAMAVRGEAGAERLDERRLADAGHAADPDPPGSTGPGQQFHQQLLRGLPVVGPARLHERDRAGQHPAGAVQHPLGESRHVDRAGHGPPSVRGPALSRAAAR